MKKKAFTLAETLIAMAIIGIVALIAVSPKQIINQTTTQKNKILFKKQYAKLLDATNTLLKDQTNFPNGDIIMDSEKIYTTTPATTDLEKVHKLYAGLIPHTGYTYDAHSTSTFTAKDGSFWKIYFPAIFVQIYIDINGISNGPNCPENFLTNTITAGTCTSGRDTFQFMIGGESGVTIEDKYDGNSENQIDWLTTNGYID